MERTKGTDPDSDGRRTAGTAAGAEGQEEGWPVEFGLVKRQEAVERENLPENGEQKIGSIYLYVKIPDFLIRPAVISIRKTESISIQKTYTGKKVRNILGNNE